MNMEKMVNYCKNYGFIFQGSEIYGGLSNTFDYGPLGAELKNNLKVYVDFYKAIVDNINANIDKNYTLEQAYKSIHSLYTFRGFKYFEYIREELYNLCYHPNTLEKQEAPFLVFN